MIGIDDDHEVDDKGDLVTVKTQVKTILTWPSDTFSIDYGHNTSAQNHHRSPSALPPVVVHTIIVFIPGNPGLIDWYIPFFTRILKRLGPGFACRGVALVGHSLDPKLVDVERYNHDNNTTCSPNSFGDTAIPWTVDGQVLHKCAYMDSLLEDFDQGSRPETKRGNDSGTIKDGSGATIRLLKPRFVVISHSIGAHFTQRMCMLRPDILQRTQLLIHLMPFIRMDAPTHIQVWLNTCARAPETAIAIVKALCTMIPRSMLDKILSCTMNDKGGRDIAVQLLQIPTFVRNFGLLGFEEIRDVPQSFDVSAMRYIGQRFGCPTDLLYAGNDHWAPDFHMKQLKELQAQKAVPDGDKIFITYKQELQHDFVSRSEQVPIVMEYCVNRIQRVVLAQNNQRLLLNDGFVASNSKHPLRAML